MKRPPQYQSFWPKQRGSTGELALAAQLRKEKGWFAEYRFDPVRRWRFDFANPDLMLAIEIDGGSAIQAHGQVSRRELDYDKGNEATAQGWRILRGSTRQAEDGSLLAFVRRCSVRQDHRTATAESQRRSQNSEP